jgi:4-hydroxy-tetrahydrodipicolinate synthase
MGKIQEEFRLPLCEMAPANREKLKAVLKDMKLI